MKKLTAIALGMMFVGLAGCSQPDRADRRATTPQLATVPATNAGQSLIAEPVSAGQPFGAALQPADAGVGILGVDAGGDDNADAGTEGLDAGVVRPLDDAGVPSPPPIPGADAGLPL